MPEFASDEDRFNAGLLQLGVIDESYLVKIK